MLILQKHHETHQLRRGGALHTVAITRMRCHLETQTYEAKRTAQSKTHRDIRRCLKRSIAAAWTASYSPRPAPATPLQPLAKHRSVERFVASVLPDLSSTHPSGCSKVSTALNARPRKTLGGITPAQAMQRLLSEAQTPIVPTTA
jgi:hypothetical protein